MRAAVRVHGVSPSEEAEEEHTPEPDVDTCTCGRQESRLLHLQPQAEAGRNQLSSDILCLGIAGLSMAGDSGLVILGSQLESV